MNNDYNELPEELKKEFEDGNCGADPQPEEDFRKQFHKWSSKGFPTAPIDFYIKEDIKNKFPLFVLGQIPWLYDRGVFRIDQHGTKLKKYIENYIYPELRNSKTINRICELLIQDDDLQLRINEVNQYPAEWVCFQNGFYDPISGTMKDHSPEYKAVNQIPFDFHPEAKNQGPTTDRWLNEMFPADDDQFMFLEYCGLMMNRDTRFQKSLFLVGEGGTGKSTLINHMIRLVGMENTSSLTLENLNERFYPSQLFGKLLNTCADIKTRVLTETDGFKKIVGEDLIQYERKGKDGYPFRSYAKLLFSMNEVPLIKGENTQGYFRRLLIIRMNRVIEEPDPELPDKLAAELPYFIELTMFFLRMLYDEKKITESENSRREVEKVRCDSDSVQAFLTECCNVSPKRTDWKCDRAKLFGAYKDFCREYERIPVSNQNFYKSLESKGHSFRLLNGYKVVFGIQYPRLDGVQMAIETDSMTGKTEIRTPEPRQKKSDPEVVKTPLVENKTPLQEDIDGMIFN